MPTKVLEEIQQWEYIDLSILPIGIMCETSNVTVSHEGQLLVLGALYHPHSRRKVIADITT